MKSQSLFDFTSWNSDDSDSALQAATDQTMHPAYFETLFDAHGFSGEWPARFAIVTAWATTGTCLSQAANDEQTGNWNWNCNAVVPGGNALPAILPRPDMRSRDGRWRCRLTKPASWHTGSCRMPYISSMRITCAFRTVMGDDRELMSVNSALA